MQTNDHRREVDRNYDVFQRHLAGYLAEHKDEFALMHGGKVMAFHDTPGDAYRQGLRDYPDGRFSIQEVTDEPIDLGFFSHVGN